MSDRYSNEQTLHPIPLLTQKNQIKPVSSLFSASFPGHLQAILPASFFSFSNDRRYFLRMDRVGCNSLLTVSNEKGQRIQRTHYGSYTDWEFEITSVVSLSSPLTVDLSLEADETTLSSYQKAGILGEILLLDLPSTCLSDFCCRPIHTDSGWNIHTTFQIESANTLSDPLSILTEVKDPAGALVCSQLLSCLSSTDYAAETAQALAIPDAEIWQPEHPFLYQISLSLLQSGLCLEQCRMSVGLRTLEKSGQQILWNGQPLKLKGLTYREPLPSEGFDPASDLKLFQDAHINYLRSLYYPFSKRFLTLCDEAGILVEQSAPVDGVGHTLAANQNAPALRDLFLGQHQDMLIRDRSHTCILLWSLGNESVWGDNFHQELDLTRKLDPDRLINFHYPMTIPQEEWIPDVWNMQYASWNMKSDVCYDQTIIFHTQGADNPIGYALGVAQDYQLPVLHDAFALVPVYDREELEKDAGLHEFWGKSLAHFWENLHRTKGALGGAIMAAVDEDGSFHPSLKDYFWGILDSSHHPKPEYWHVKMVYSEDPLSISHADGYLKLSNRKLSCLISERTGLIHALWIQGEKILSHGPFLQTGRFRLGAWKLDAFHSEPIEKGMLLTIQGTYGTDCQVTFSIRLMETGELFTSCRLDQLLRPWPHTVKAGIGLDPGGLDEFGIRYCLTSADTLTWLRRGLWPEYPDSHIGRPKGTALRNDPFDFTSRKTDLLDATIDSSRTSVQVLPEPGQSLRLELIPDPRCVLDDCETQNELLQLSWNGEWISIKDEAGIQNPTETMSHAPGASLTITFEGSGLKIYGTTDRIRGCCDIWIDGQLVGTQISQHTPAVYFPSMSRGYEKRFHQLLFSIDTLPLGTHECQVIVSGEKEAAAQETWISIDSVESIHPQYPPLTFMNLCQDYNYTRLVYGNYMNPAILPQVGDSISCHLYLQKKSDVLSSTESKTIFQEGETRYEHPL